MNKRRGEKGDLYYGSCTGIILCYGQTAPMMTALGKWSVKWWIYYIILMGYVLLCAYCIDKFYSRKKEFQVPKWIDIMITL